MTAHAPVTEKPAAPSRASKVQQIVTPRGISAWLVEDYAVPLVAFDFAFKAGAANDPAGKSGATNMLAALLDEGAGDMDSDTFHRALDDKAVELAFHAGHDTLSGDLKTLSRHVDAAFDLLQVAVNKPRFDADAIERVRAQTIAGLKHEANDPDALASRAWRRAAFPGHPYASQVSGDLETVPAITREDILSLHGKIMARSNLRIAAVGAIDAARLSAYVDKVFGDLPAEPGVGDIAEIEPAAGTRTVVDVDVPQTTIRFSLPGISRKDPDYMTAIVVNHILGGGTFSSWLFQEVREVRGLAYSVWSHLQNYNKAALFSGGTSTKNERAAESLSVIEEQIARLVNEGPTEDELEKGKKYLIGSYALRFDTSTKIAGNLVSLQVEGYPVEFLDRRNEMIAAVTLADVNRVAKRMFEGKKLLVAAAGRPVGM
jgi:zinc protease